MKTNTKPVKPVRATFACDPTYGPLVPAAKAFGICRSKAFALAGLGKLATFTIGTRRYVYLDSLRSLPERLAANDAAGGDA
jgi:hypothetical protein